MLAELVITRASPARTRCAPQHIHLRRHVRCNALRPARPSRTHLRRGLTVPPRVPVHGRPQWYRRARRLCCSIGKTVETVTPTSIYGWVTANHDIVKLAPGRDTGVPERWQRTICLDANELGLIDRIPSGTMVNAKQFQNKELDDEETDSDDDGSCDDRGND